MTSFDHSAIWGEHPGVYIVVYEHDVHLKITNYELHKSTHAHTHAHTYRCTGTNIRESVLTIVLYIPHNT